MRRRTPRPNLPQPAPTRPNLPQPARAQEERIAKREEKKRKGQETISKGSDEVVEELEKALGVAKKHRKAVKGQDKLFEEDE